MVVKNKEKRVTGGGRRAAGRSMWGQLECYGWRKCGSGGCFSGICCISFTCARVVQGERRAELVRALLSRSPHSQKHLHCFCKVTKKTWNFQIVSRENCTFGDKNCTFVSFWCFLENVEEVCVSGIFITLFAILILSFQRYTLQITVFLWAHHPQGGLKNSKICK